MYQGAHRAPGNGTQPWRCGQEWHSSKNCTPGPVPLCCLQTQGSTRWVLRSVRGHTCPSTCIIQRLHLSPKKLSHTHNHGHPCAKQRLKGPSRSPTDLPSHAERVPPGSAG